MADNINHQHSILYNLYCNKMTELKDNELYYWHKNTAGYRKNLDLATIFWLWSKVEKNFDPAEKFEQILNLIGMESIHHVDPSQLWGQVDIKQLYIPQYSNINCFTIKFQVWVNTYKGALNKAAPDLKLFSLEWFAKYRGTLGFSTPFLDYYVIQPNQASSAYLGSESIIFRDTSLAIKSNFIKGAPTKYLEGMAYTTNEYKNGLGIMHPILGDGKYTLKYLEGMIYTTKKYKNGLGIMHPILGDAKYTHRFIDLDNLMMKAKINRIKIPPIFSSPLMENHDQPISQSKSHIPNWNKSISAGTRPISQPKPQIPSWEKLVTEATRPTGSSQPEPPTEIPVTNHQNKFDPTDQFGLLRITPEIIKYLKDDPIGKQSFENKSHTAIKKELCEKKEMIPAHIDHIWRIIMPPSKRRNANTAGLHLQENLISIRNKFWPQNTDDVVKIWTRENKIKELTDLGYNEKEAKSFIALLSPLDNKKSGKLSESKLLEFRDLINEIDLSWTKNLSIYS